ncbi:MAG TPA: hypothetical protein VF520_14680 [Thermoleophilaceae bacterium]|jgi:hypothetical protein
MRRLAPLVAFVLVVAVAVAVVVLATGDDADEGEPRAAACAKVDEPQQGLMDAYSSAGPFPARQAPGDPPASVAVEVPPIDFSGAGRTPTLPVGPCQYIYRFRYPEVRAPAGAAPSPFSYVEVDWNTEGMPRGPNGSFASPHFDFHFYLRTRAEVDRTTECVLSSNGKTCDALKTPYAQMRRFLDMPPARLVPDGYRPDVDSSIPEMGLHLLDMTLPYTVEKVNHYPVLIYGTFDGEILFAEASVTLFTLQDAMAAPGHAVTFPFRQPPEAPADRPWPTRFAIRYVPRTRTFRVGLEDLRPAR